MPPNFGASEMEPIVIAGRSQSLKQSKNWRGRSRPLYTLADQDSVYRNPAERDNTHEPKLGEGAGSSSAFSAVIARTDVRSKENPRMYTYVNFRNIPHAVGRHG
jgi:hypothetical protein